MEGNFTNIWINNAGFEGMSTFGHIVLVQDNIIQLKPKVVLFLIGINDQGRDDLTQQDRDVLRAPNSAYSVGKNFLNSSEFVIFVQNFIRYTRTQSWSVGHATVDFETLPVLEMSERDMFQRVDYHHQHYLEPYQARVKRLVVIARDNNIEPVLITQPAVYGDVEDPATGVNFANKQFGDANGKVQWEMLELYNEVTRQVGIDHNVTVIDLANKMPKDSDYYYDFLHFTEAGSERVAEIIYSELCPFLVAKYNQYVMNNC